MVPGSARGCLTSPGLTKCALDELPAGASRTLRFRAFFEPDYAVPTAPVPLEIAMTADGRDVPVSGGTKTSFLVRGTAWPVRAIRTVLGGSVVTGAANWTCPASYIACSEKAPAIAVDSDDDKETTNSSAAPLKLPPGSTIAWAGLYWSGVLAERAEGRTANDRGGPLQADRVRLRLPSDNKWTEIQGKLLDSGKDTERLANGGRYTAFADVTNALRGTVGGEVEVADIAGGAAGPGGWMLIVAFQSDGAALQHSGQRWRRSP